MKNFILCEYMLKKIQEGKIKFDDAEQQFYIDITDADIDIIFCPFCGRELKEMENE